MRRRALLSALATGTAALSGCSVLGGPRDEQSAATPAADDPDGGSRATDGDPDESPAGDDWLADASPAIELSTRPRAVGLHATSFTTDDGAAVRLGFDRTATADGPARLRGYLANANDFENTVRTGRIPGVGVVLAPRSGEGSPHKPIYLVPTEHNDLAETVPEIVREDGYWFFQGRTDTDPWMPETHRMDPGERARLEYYVVSSAWKPGTYELSGHEEAVGIGVWDATSPGPDGDSRFDGRSVPPIPRRFREDDATIQWYHESDADTRAFVRPATERLELDGRLEFEFVNHSREPLECGGWSLYKLVDGQWFRVEPERSAIDCSPLGPGERSQWTIRAFNGGTIPCYGRECFTADYLGGGTYAVAAGFGPNTDGSGALVELVGDPVEIVPTDDAAAERDGGTVTVTTERYREADPSFRGRVVLTPVDDESEQRSSTPRSSPTHGDHELLIAEVIMRSQNRTLRNGLAYAGDDVDRVVVRTGVAARDATDPGEDRRRFRFRGRAYEVRQVSDED
ncbi:hypothetical protein [Halomicrobium salinisoli]|uniref:hypothetical protein n=1 Tax=Halomicrobium salinisoli TaxID=2878391 RepID=UPI001CF0B425|nr:hypothetical protein [Halomicrobium salinisoli]